MAVRASDPYASAVAPPKGFSEYVQLGQDPGVGPGLTGGIKYPAWPGSTSGPTQEELERVAGEKEA